MAGQELTDDGMGSVTDGAQAGTSGPSSVSGFG